MVDKYGEEEDKISGDGNDSHPTKEGYRRNRG